MMRAYLAEGGLIVFETRNPLIDWHRRWHGETTDLMVDGVAVRQRLQVFSVAADRIAFETRYEFPDEVLVSASELRFLSREAIETYLSASGLRVETVVGDWNGEALDSASSDEMIFFARRA
jgi:hypothetical protein